MGLNGMNCSTVPAKVTVIVNSIAGRGGGGSGEGEGEGICCQGDGEGEASCVCPGGGEW